jgi:hypothetical protein
VQRALNSAGVLGEVASHHDRPDVATAEAHYGSAPGKIRWPMRNAATPNFYGAQIGGGSISKVTTSAGLSPMFDGGISRDPFLSPALSCLTRAQGYCIYKK